MLNIYLTNLGKYNEGELVGKWVELPCYDYTDVLEEIGVSDEPDEFGRYYEEYFITDFETDIDEVTVGEYDNVDDLNEMAEALEGVDADIIGALIGEGYSLDNALNKVSDCILWSDCNDMSDVAYRYYEETGILAELEKHINVNYIDFEAIGRDISLENHFIPCGDGFLEVLY